MNATDLQETMELTIEAIMAERGPMTLKQFRAAVLAKAEKALSEMMQGGLVDDSQVNDRGDELYQLAK